ncbi:WXG100 family type VII secretion target [Paenibacillus psychroresistens]|uniref:WXG100 family type VII secretion target n=1 Tax=Paenibacillus psychroresistens TaxID=1778678 RepID=A0A6B8RUJ5_9BACL|nr:WXG100 family type VII secretion target [Paenibacillus psychroresistens]QGQ98828.1 WXG100 family type VII secretion target [Paenibacillus psychroresistens]
MATDIKVSYGELEGKSQKMYGFQTEFETLIRNANDLIKSLNEAWDSTAQKNYAEEFGRLKTSAMDPLHLMLGEYAKFLHDSSDIYLKADEAISKALGKTTATTGF